MSFGIAGDQFTQSSDSADYTEENNENSQNFPHPLVNPNPWIEPTLWQRVDAGQEEVRVTVISHSLRELNAWQYKHGQIENQAGAIDGQTLVVTDPSDGVIDHRTFWMNSELFHKLPGVSGVIGILDAQNSPDPFDTIPLSDENESPTSVRSGEIHGATDAWAVSYTQLTLPTKA